jgi:hypothetical protein
MNAAEPDQWILEQGARRQAVAAGGVVARHAALLGEEEIHVSPGQEEVSKELVDRLALPPRRKRKGTLTLPLAARLDDVAALLRRRGSSGHGIGNDDELHGSILQKMTGAT